jgi:alpha-D-ribose 1-methylphosphonate 5-triphosphate synthase subunit PhnG
MTTDTAPDQRQRWLAVLARAPRDELESAAQAFGVRDAGVPVRPPECGMVMLRGRTGGTGEAFNLGEATVTRSAVRVGTALGVGYVLGRDRAQAELVALFDALLQDPVRRPALMRQLVEPLAAQQAGRAAERSRAAAASRVEFFTMVRGEAA